MVANTPKILHNDESQHYETLWQTFPGNLEPFSFEFETKTGEPNANSVSGVLIGFANTQHSANVRDILINGFWNMFIWRHVLILICRVNKKCWLRTIVRAVYCAARSMM